MKKNKVAVSAIDQVEFFLRAQYMIEDQIRTYSSEDKDNSQHNQYDWEHISNFFLWTDHIWGKKYFVTIHIDGKVLLTQKQTENAQTRFVELWEQWCSSIKKQAKLIEFEYPAWSLVKDCNDLFRSRLAVIAGVSLCVGVILLYPTISTSSEVVNISHTTQFALSLTLFASLFLGLFCIRSRKRLWKVSIINEDVIINFINGSIKKFSLCNIKRYRIDPSTRNAFILFKDGTQLRHLERVSYWPILREHLITKLQEAKYGTSLDKT